MAKHNQLGHQGEQIAQQFLYNKGFDLLDTNWRYKHVEIDIVARDKNTLVFVEVKTRSGDEFGSPLDALSSKKIENLIEAASAYLDQFDEDLEWRFDAIGIVSNEDGSRIEYLADAFRPEF